MDALPLVVDFIKTVGFPAAVAAFVLWRLDKSLRELTGELKAFREVIMAANASLEKHISERADFVVHEVDHNLRIALSATPIVLRKP